MFKQDIQTKRQNWKILKALECPDLGPGMQSAFSTEADSLARKNLGVIVPPTTQRAKDVLNCEIANVQIKSKLLTGHQYV